MKGAVGTQRGVTHPERLPTSHFLMGGWGGFSETGESREELRNKYFFWVFENSIVVDSNGAGTGLTA